MESVLGVNLFLRYKPVFLLCLFTMDCSNSEQLKQLTLQGLLPMSGGGWDVGGACLPATLMAVRDVNERAGLLDDYNLTFTLKDSKCNPGVATYRMIQSLTQPPTKIMLLGCGCSVATIVTAQVSHRFNITQLSALSTSPTLSDRKRFPNFYRIDSPDHLLHPTMIALMKKYNWKKVATINQALEYFSSVIDDLVQRLKGANITVISQEIYQNDPFTRVENLKKHDARIIVTASYEDKSNLVFCAAYKLGLYGPKIVWIIYGWFGYDFWRRNLEDVPCTLEEMDEVLQGAFLVSVHFRNRIEERGVAGLTVTEFDVLYKKEETYNASHSVNEHISALCYDHIWIAALALNCTETKLQAIGHPKSLDQFTYQDKDINDIILSCMSNVSLTGVSGRVLFENGIDPIKDCKVQRVQGADREYLGTYVMVEHPRHFEWKDGGIKWKDGHVPLDSTYVTSEEVSIPLWLYITMATLSAIGILIALVFLAFNIKYRGNRTVKMSSPNINNVLLIGCILTYSTVFMTSTDQDLATVFCKIRTFCFCVGFTVAFGALFSKTWRVYKIFTNKELLKVSIQDYQLIGVVCALSVVMVIVLIIWEFVGPQALVVKELVHEVYLVGHDAEVRPYIRVCYSEYDIYFSWTIYIMEGVLMGFGAFLAWETRQVKIEALNDSRQIGMCLYNVVVLSAVGLLFSLLLDEKIIVVYTITSACVIIGTTLTQTVIFVPKVLAVFRNGPESDQALQRGATKSFPSISQSAASADGKQLTQESS